jgi:hypothetical protein
VTEVGDERQSPVQEFPRYSITPCNAASRKIKPTATWSGIAKIKAATRLLDTAQLWLIIWD